MAKGGKKKIGNLGALLAEGDATAKEELRRIVSSFEALAEDMAAAREDQKQVIADGKAKGFDPKIVRAVIRKRKMDPAKAAEEDAIVDLYLVALGDTPLFKWADEQARKAAEGGRGWRNG